MQNISESLFFIQPTIKYNYTPVFHPKAITVMMLSYFLIVILKIYIAEIVYFFCENLVFCSVLDY